MAVHPDKQQDKGDEEFQLLQQAKETLIDPSKRKHYDTYLSIGSDMPLTEWMKNRERLQQVGFEIFSIFSNEPIFGRFYSTGKLVLDFVSIN